MVLKMKYNKYSNIKTQTSDGNVFDSKAEARRWIELKLLERAGEIKDLQRQVKYILIPAQKEGKKTIERECSYVADFVYTEVKTGNTVVEDTKGYRSKEYIIKRKLMLYVHQIKIKEVK